MRLIFSLLIASFLLLCGCQPIPHQVQLPKTKHPYLTLEGEQYDHCKGYTWTEKNMVGESLIGLHRCLDEGKGYFWAYIKGTNDTLLYLPFKANPSYRRPNKKERLISPRPKDFFPFIADGEAYISAYIAYRLNYDFTYHNIYIAPDSVFSVHSTLDPLIFEYNPRLGVAFVRYGEQRGCYKNGRREGRWWFRQHRDSQQVPYAENQPQANWQIHHFKDGLVHGTSLVYDQPQTTWDGSSLGNELFYERNYQHGQRHGWQYNYQQQGQVVDSVYYENGSKRD